MHSVFHILDHRAVVPFGFEVARVLCSTLNDCVKLLITLATEHVDKVLLRRQRLLLESVLNQGRIV